jgi:hypothetical protein
MEAKVYAQWKNPSLVAFGCFFAVEKTAIFIIVPNFTKGDEASV